MFNQKSLQVQKQDADLSQPAVPARRLVVLVPEQDTDEVSFARSIYTLAGPRFPEILLVTIVTATEPELSARRRLATISMYLRDLQFSVGTRVQRSKSWLQALSDEVKPGDLLVYPPELTQRDGMFKQMSLESALQPLNTPLYPLPGFFNLTKSRPRPQILRRLAYWGVLALTLMLFFSMEGAISTSIQGGMGHLLTIMIVFMEFGIVYVWTAIAG